MRLFIVLIFLFSSNVHAKISNKDHKDIFTGCISEAKKSYDESIGMWYEYCGCFTHNAGKIWTINDLRNLQNKNHTDYKKLKKEFDNLVRICLNKSS